MQPPYARIAAPRRRGIAAVQRKPAKPVRTALVHPGPRALELAKFAHEELGLLHFMACLANKQAPRPSELLKALGVARPDADYGKLMLAEHVPDAA